MLFLDQLLHNCQTLGDKTAVSFIQPNRTDNISYTQLHEIVGKTMGYLHNLGVRPGDRVALQLPKCLPFIYLHLATIRLGAITLPLNPAYPEHELTYFLQNSGAKLFFGDAVKQAELATIVEKLASLETATPTGSVQAVFLQPNHPTDFLNRIAPFAPASDDAINPDTVALMVYTSGTTGRPKGSLTTHANLTANIFGLHKAWGWQQNDVLLHVLPIFHVHGLSVALHGALNAGATTIMLPKFETEAALEAIVRQRCTVFMAVPTIHKRLVDYPNAADYDLSHMRLLTSGSDRLPDDVCLRFRQLYGHVLLERYGMTETGMNLSNPYTGERRVGSVGKPLPGVEARVVNPETGDLLPHGEVGEVQIRGPHVFKGYWQMPEKTAASFTEDGWLKTGDMGLCEPDGYFTLKGRSKDLIITGGLNVYPPEVELVLADLPQVAASAVIGCPSDEWGETVTAVLVLRDGHTVGEQEVIDHCRSRLAPYKAPRRVLFADALPRNALGKVQKAKLRASVCS